MAPSSGSALIPVALRLTRQAIQKAQTFVRSKLPESTRALGGELQPVRIRNAPTHPLHRIAYLRQSKGRWYTTHSSINATIRRYTSAHASIKSSRASLPRSTISSAVNRLTSRAPFASTLRPNLTGGALPRTSGGYSIGAGRLGGVRHFSHTPAAPAQVVQNVSTAMRAFLLSGNKAQYDGRDASGQPRYKPVSTLQSTTSQKLRSLPIHTPGTSLDFAVTPTITALSPLAFPSQQATTLQSSPVLSSLSIDFARALKDLSLILSDLQRLSALGDLQLSMPDRSTLRVHFPGCDHQTVERLCTEFDIQRGLIRQDADFEVHTGAELALLFPFAPSGSPSSGVDRDPVDWQTMLSPGYSHRSDTGTGTGTGFERLSSPGADGTDTEGYASMHESDASASDDDAGMYFHALSRAEAQEPSRVPMSSPTSAEEYEGLEGIHRFLAECDGARRPW